MAGSVPMSGTHALTLNKSRHRLCGARQEVEGWSRRRRRQLGNQGVPDEAPAARRSHRGAAYDHEGAAASSLDEVTGELFRRAGTKVSTGSVRKALRESGSDWLKPLRHAGQLAALHGQRLPLCAAHGSRVAAKVFPRRQASCKDVSRWAETGVFESRCSRIVVSELWSMPQWPHTPPA